MARPRRISPETEQEILRLRHQGYTCKDTAARLGVTRGAVYYTMRRNGLNGKIHAGRSGKPGKRRPSRAASLADKVRRHGEITLETGLNNGFLATIDGKVTGSESRTLLGAINSAEEAQDDEA